MRPGTVEVQASLLVLHDPDAPSLTLPMEPAPASSAPRMPPVRSMPQRDHMLPASTWKAMSALAGAARMLPCAAICRAHADGMPVGVTIANVLGSHGPSIMKLARPGRLP